MRERRVKIAVIGTGAMGSVYAASLADAGNDEAVTPLVRALEERAAGAGS